MLGPLYEFLFMFSKMDVRMRLSSQINLSQVSLTDGAQETGFNIFIYNHRKVLL